MNNKQLYSSFFMDGTTDEKIKWQKLYDFLDSFDPIELKFSLEPYSVHPPLKKKIIPYHIRGELIKYDSVFQTGSLNKETYDSIIDNLMLVYGSEKVVKSDVQIFNITEKRMISQYLGIPQLEKMFDEDYFQFEWDMHIAQNYREHRSDYQRDHFIHEIRDMYSMMVLLGNYGFYKASEKVLLDKSSSSKISRYTQKKLIHFMNKRSGDVYTTIEKLVCKMSKEVDSNTELTNEEKEKYKDESKYIQSYFMKYVIYASSILSALFHDMGYPICHFLEVRNRTSEYNPTLYMYTRNATESFDHIASLLGSSLLFTIVSRDEIKKSMNPNKKGKYDHGAYSAIAFLLQFYNSGIIFSLSEEKQCAIELAAVAIYNHTMKFKIEDENEKTNFYQLVFNQNPIAFMLRLCDDLQEWGRRYFVISSESDIPICSSCLTPSIFKFPKNGADRDKILYSCACSENKARTSNAEKLPTYNSFRYKNFYNRKLYMVSTSDYMYSHIINVEGGKKALCFHINYDYYKLLNVSRINHTYAKFRLREINKLKKLIKEQDYKSHFDFDYIFLDYFMTSNPITIKLKILEKFIAFALKDGKTRLNPEDIQEGISLNNIIEKLKFPANINYDKSELKNLLERGNEHNEGFEFYKQLLKKVIGLRNDTKGKEFDVGKVKREADNYINQYFSSCPNFSAYYKQIMKNLLFDTFEQYAKEIIIERNGNNYTVEDFHSLDKYYDQYAPNKHMECALYNSVQAYCNAENDFNGYYVQSSEINDKIPYLNYFADLYLFEEMNRVVQEKYISEFFTDDV